MTDTEESPSQRQARLRREKREKKILEGGSSRLDKITNVSGRAAAEKTEKTTAESPANVASPAHSPFRPVSQSHNHAPGNQNSSNDPTQDQLEMSMRQLLRSNTDNTTSTQQPQQKRQQRPTPYPNEANSQQEPQDPMLAMLQQLMGANMPPTLDAEGNPSGPSAGGATNGFEGLPPALAAMLGGGGTGGGPGSTGPPPEAARGVYIWKILHAVFSLLLGLYILYTYTFSGTLGSRLRIPRFTTSGLESSLPAEGSLFWIFITAELGLQGGRYLLEGGRSSEEGMIKTISGFLPHPWGARVSLVSRYASIWSTLVQDAFVVVFLLGVAAWWRGERDGSAVVA